MRIRNLGTYIDFNALWEAHPEGGHEGDYVTVDSTEYVWNKYRRTWGDSNSQEQEVIPYDNPGLTLTEVWDSLVGNVARPDLKINLAHIPDIPAGRISGLNTWLTENGYSTGSGGGGSYTLPAASQNALGGIRIGYQGEGYPVLLDANNKAYVNVPWQAGINVAWGTPGTDSIQLTVGDQTRTLLTAHQSLADYVTRNTQQEISGEKTFTTAPVNIASSSGLKVDGGSYIDLGDARLVYDSNLHSLHVTKRPGSSYDGDISMYADGDTGAGGPGGGSGSGSTYTLPIASANDLGGVKIGTGLSIDPNTGILSVSGGGSGFNGGEITNDLWIHTDEEDYGGKLIFGDMGNSDQAFVYLHEDTDDHLTIYARKGITLAVDPNAEGNPSVVIPNISIPLGGLSNVSLSNVAPGQALVFRDGSWTNETISGGGSTYNLPIASANGLGGVKIGTGLSIDPNTGVLSVSGGGGSYTLPAASQNALGGIRIGYQGEGYPVLLDANNKAYVNVPWQAGINVAWGTPGTDSIPLTVGDQTKTLLTAHQSLADYVTRNTQQEISGEKTFTTAPVNIASSSGLKVDGGSYIDLGDARLVYDSNLHSLHVTKRPGSSYDGDISLHADGDLGAGGVGSGSSVKYSNVASQEDYEALTKNPATIYTVGSGANITKVYLGTVQLYPQS